MLVDIYIAKQGMGMTEATLTEWRVTVGAAVQQGDVVAVISTDKVEMEVEAPATGQVMEQLVAEGQDFEVPTVIGRIQPTE